MTFGPSPRHPKSSWLTRSIASAAAAALLAGSITALPAFAGQQSDKTAGVAEALTTDTNPADHPADRFIVKFDGNGDGTSERGRTYQNTVNSLGIPVTEVGVTVDGATVVEATEDLTAEQSDGVVAALESRGDVEYAEVDVFMQPTAIAPDDDLYDSQWNLFEAEAGMRVDSAWERSTGAGVTVAVIDTGITEHSDLAGNIIPGYDFITSPQIAGDNDGRDSDPTDEGDQCNSDPSSWHGTHVAGTIGAVANNSQGIAGVAYDSQIQPIRALGACGGYTSDVAAATLWAAGGSVPGLPLNPTPAKVINLSLGGAGTCGTTFQTAINYANSQNAVVITAAGNENTFAKYTTPANCNNVVVVGATGREGNKANYSNHGPEVDVSAPGGDASTGRSSAILSTLNSGAGPETESYGYLQGTSMATPHVAGAAALMLSVDPSLTPAQVEAQLKATSRPFPGVCYTGGCGTGLVDAAAAVKAVAPAVNPQPFSDVPEGMKFQREMSWMAASGISTGWTESDGARAYRPLTAVNRDAMAAFMYRMAGSPAFTPPTRSPFADVDTSQKFYLEMAWLASTGISTDWAGPNGTKTYRALTPVNRDAMAAFMYRMAGSPAFTPPTRSPFADVDTSQKFYLEMAWLASTGISTGWAGPNGTKTYHALTPVNRDAMAAFMYRFSEDY
ncbi:S8 family peptidase [Arthrobacter sp. TB 23]|uniref:S8 family peptidase n=1 Tax=Arthrobacter sp. TB 23 TaxID=494419 RepID=UPI0002E0B5B1|nr:S8 family peptidase [Arthrobacter sp. TB 23]